jgi:hypothetical protein
MPNHNHIYNIDTNNANNVGNEHIKDIYANGVPTNNARVNIANITSIPTTASLTSFTSSIPTIFQRMRLFEQAFEAGANNALPLSALHKQIISECLDVFELIYKYPNNIVYKVWDKQAHVERLRNEGFNRLPNLIDKFWAVDVSALSELVMIYYKTAAGTEILLGGNSPYTVFFTSPNWSRKVAALGLPPQTTGNASATTYNLFHDVKLLNERDRDFIEFMITFARATQNILPPLLLQYLQNRHGNLYKTYDYSRVVIHDIEIILRFMFRNRNNNALNDYYNYFKIGATNKYAFPTLAEVLNINNRNVIPNNSTIINADTIFTDSVFRLPFNVQKDKFIYPNTSDNFNTVLPLKVVFFSHFTENDLLNHLTLTSAATILNAQLVVETYNGRKVILEKKVSQPEDGYAFNLAIAPIIAQNREFWIKSVYLNTRKVQLRFYNDQNQVIANPEQTPNTVNPYIHENYYLRDSFKTIEFDNTVKSTPTTTTTKTEGILIPKLNMLPYTEDGVNEYTFAIDFGTTNTFVAYYTNISLRNPVAFNLNKHLILLSPGDKTKFDTFPESLDWLERTFIPAQIEGEQLPHRTAIYSPKGAEQLTGWLQTDKNYLKYGNIGFYYSKETTLIQKKENTIIYDDKYLTNIKWNPRFVNQSRLFIRELMWLLKLKANGAGVKLIFTYPLAIAPTFNNMIQTEVNAIFPPVNGVGTVIETQSESIAPFYYENINFDQTYINIDIGGGSTDIMIATPESTERNMEMFATSMRYGANFIWWTGLKPGYARHNGFIAAIKKHNVVSSELIKELITCYSDYGNPPAEDILSLALSDTNDQFVGSLQQGAALTHYRIVLFLHFSSILYHISQLLRDIKIDVVTNIPTNNILLRFTGKGSLYLKIIFPTDYQLDNSLKELLASFLDTTLHKVTVQQLVDTKAKQATAFGALKLSQTTGADRIVPTGIIHSGLLHENPSDRIKDIYKQGIPFNVTDMKISKDSFKTSLGRSFSHFMGVLKSDSIKLMMTNLGFTPDELAYLNAFESMAYQDFDYIRDFEIGNGASVLGDRFTISSSPFFWFFQESLSSLARHIARDKKYI